MSPATSPAVTTSATARFQDLPYRKAVSAAIIRIESLKVASPFNETKSTSGRHTGAHSAITDTATVGTQVATYAVAMSDGSPFTGTLKVPDWLRKGQRVTVMVGD